MSRRIATILVAVSLAACALDTGSGDTEVTDPANVQGNWATEGSLTQPCSAHCAPDSEVPVLNIITEGS